VVLLALTCLGVAITVLAPSEDSGDQESEAETTGPTAYPTRKPTPQVIVTQKGERIEVGGIAYMDGRDPDAKPPCTIMHINVWDQVPGQKVVCSLVHGDKVHVLAARPREDDRYYFKVSGPGACTGWVSGPFLSTEFQNLVGDPVY